MKYIVAFVNNFNKIQLLRKLSEFSYFYLLTFKMFSGLWSQTQGAKITSLGESTWDPCSLQTTCRSTETPQLRALKPELWGLNVTGDLIIKLVRTFLFLWESDIFPLFVLTAKPWTSVGFGFWITTPVLMDFLMRIFSWRELLGKILGQ